MDDCTQKMIFFTLIRSILLDSFTLSQALEAKFDVSSQLIWKWADLNDAMLA